MTGPVTSSSLTSPQAPESLAAAVARVGSPVELLRNAKTGAVRAQPFVMSPEFTNWRSEQRAWEESCVLFDQTDSMTDLFLSGPDAQRLLERVAVNSFATFGLAKAKQLVAVSPDGHLVGDGVLFHLEEGHYDLTGHPMVIDWVQFHAATGGFDVVAERDDNSALRTSGPPRFYRYEVQGPTAVGLVEQVIGGPVPQTKFFQMARLTVAGHQVWALRHGMAGQPGFELFGPWAEGADVLGAVLTAGADHGLVRAGAKAYSTANLGSGWVPAPLPAIFGVDPMLAAYREWLPADAMGSVGGSMDSSDVADYYLTPYDLGYGFTVKFDHDFIGRQALEEMAADQRRTKVTLVWNSDDVTAAVGSLYTKGPGAKYIDMPKARYTLHQEDKVLHGGELVGISMDCGYLANERAMISLATVNKAFAEPGTKVTVLWGEQPNSTKPQVEEHVQISIRATVAPVPFVQYARDTYRAR